MNRLLKLGLLMALVIGLFGAYRYVSAQEGQSTARGSAATKAPVLQVDVPNIASTKHVLQGTYVNSGNYGDVAFPANTFSAIDPALTVTCPGTTSTCSIQADMWVQNGRESISGNEDRVCLYVDGSPGPFCNYFAGETPSDFTYTNATSSDTVSGLAHGTHTVQTVFWSAGGAFVAHYQANYHVYKP